MAELLKSVFGMTSPFPSDSPTTLNLRKPGQVTRTTVPALRQKLGLRPPSPCYGSDIQRQTRYILENLRKTFRAAGADLKNVVKTQVFLTDLVAGKR